MTTPHAHLTPVESPVSHKPQSLWNFLPGFGAEQFAAAAENACMWFSNRESLRQIQQQTAHDALVQHETAAQKLREASGPADLLNIHAELTRFYQEAVGQYWQQIAATNVQTQFEMMARANHFFSGRMNDQAKAVLNTFQAAMPLSSKADETAHVDKQTTLRLAAATAPGH